MLRLFIRRLKTRMRLPTAPQLSYVMIVGRCRASIALATNAEELVGIGSPLREASPRPEVRVIAPSHRPLPPSALAGTNASHHPISAMNRKSVSILLPETSG